MSAAVGTVEECPICHAAVYLSDDVCNDVNCECRHPRRWLHVFDDSPECTKEDAS